MKRFVLIATLLACTFGKVLADNFPFLTFEQTDGTTTTIASTGVTITFSNGNLVATQNGNTTTIALTDLEKMYFTTTNSVRNVEAQETNGYQIVSLEGCQMGTFNNLTDAQTSLKRGIYIVKEQGKTYKIYVK